MAAAAQVRISTQPQASVTDVAVIALCDSVDVDSISDQVEDLIQQGCVHLIFDYRAVSFCSSVEVAQVLQSRLRALEHGGAVHVSGLQPSVQNIFRALRLERLFALDRDTASILADYGHCP